MLDSEVVGELPGKRNTDDAKVAALNKRHTSKILGRGTGRLRS